MDLGYHPLADMAFPRHPPYSLHNTVAALGYWLDHRGLCIDIN